MTDITESDIEQLLKDPHFNESIIQFFSQKFHWGDVKAKTDQFKQQILQNQKDAQEYRKIKDSFVAIPKKCAECQQQLEIILEFGYDGIPTWYCENCKSACGYVETKELWNALKFSQSQHKKLVTAIQANILKHQEQLTKLQPHFDQYLERKNGFLDMSDEVDKIWAREYYEIQQHVTELQNLLKESEK